MQDHAEASHPQPGEAEATADPRPLIAASELFAAVSEPERALLAASMPAQRFKAGEAVVREGAPGDALYLIAQGEAEVITRDLTGQERVLATFGPGDAFGEMSLVTGAARSATVRALTPLNVLVLERTAFKSLRQRCPEFLVVLERRVDLLGTDGFLKKASPFVHLDAATI